VAIEAIQRLTGTPNVHEFPEDGTDETFKNGDLVGLTTSGTVTIAAAGKILGIARRDATGVANTQIPVDLIDTHSDFSAPLTSGETAAQTIVGDERSFVFTAGAQTLSANEGTDCVVIALDGRSLSGGNGVAGGRMVFRFQGNLLDTPTGA
jgi:hypothetical protein